MGAQGEDNWLEWEATWVGRRKLTCGSRAAKNKHLAKELKTSLSAAKRTAL